MKVAARSLVGLPLDWAVAQLHTFSLVLVGGHTFYGPGIMGVWAPSRLVGQGAEIIFKEGVAVEPVFHQRPSDAALLLVRWRAKKINGPLLVNHVEAEGKTALIAGLRCVVASHYGDTIFVPEEILRTPRQLEGVQPARRASAGNH